MGSSEFDFSMLEGEDLADVEFVHGSLPGHRFRIVRDEHWEAVLVVCGCGFSEKAPHDAEAPFRAARHASEVIKEGSRRLPGWIMREMEA